LSLAPILPTLQQGFALEEMEDTEFLDFEMEDLSPLGLCTKVRTEKKNANLIGLDELLHDHYQEKIKIVERE
jgi:hypothetical protein